MTTSIPNTTGNSRPWIWIVAAFTVMLAFWSVVVTVAVQRLPASVPIATATPHPDGPR